MDNLERYRSTIESILTRYHNIALAQSHPQSSSEATERLAFDEQRDQYLWFRFGWDNKTLVEHIIMYLCIKDGKIWVEQDATDLCVVDDLLASGVPHSDIVLGFHHPRKRMLTEFAHA
ncbi:XisI protein [Altericista sp. CCNU0014]|uniref:XisI protein n=1 Tax=Altericista sp. CCNU0014 TaxID=3082949 RepID=UPI00384F9782